MGFKITPSDLAETGIASTTEPVTTGNVLNKLDGSLNSLNSVLNTIKKLGDNPMIKDAIANKIGVMPQAQQNVQSVMPQTPMKVMPQTPPPPAPLPPAQIPVDKKKMSENIFEAIKGALEGVSKDNPKLTVEEMLTNLEKYKETIIPVIEGKMNEVQ